MCCAVALRWVGKLPPCSITPSTWLPCPAPISQHNEAKRLRAENRELQERRTRIDLEMKRDDLDDELDVEQVRSSTHSSSLSTLARYAEFMNAVQEHKPEEFTDVSAITQRHATLMDANRELKLKETASKERLSAATARLADLRASLASRKLDAANAVDKLKIDLERVNSEVGELRGMNEGALSAKGGQLLELGQVLQTVGHLVTRCANSKHGPRIKHHPTPFTDPMDVQIQLPDPHATDPSRRAHATVIIPPVDEKKRRSDALRRRRQFAPRAGASASEIAAAKEQEAALAKLRAEVAEAMQALEVVGNYVSDFDRICGDWGKDGVRASGPGGSTAATGGSAAVAAAAGERGAGGVTGSQGFQSHRSGGVTSSRLDAMRSPIASHRLSAGGTSRKPGGAAALVSDRSTSRRGAGVSTQRTETSATNAAGKNVWRVIK